MSTITNLKQTKILATIGPASNSPEKLEAIIRAGANGLRLNMSHGTHDEHAAVIKLARKVSAKLSKPISIVVDLQGPKIRIGALPADGIVFTEGQKVQFAYIEEYKAGGPVPVQHDISKYIKPEEPMFLRDGMIEVRVTKVAKGIVYGEVLNPGHILSKQGINLPDTSLGGDILTDKDKADIVFAAKNDVDYVALSFVQTPQDVLNLRSQLHGLKTNVGVIAKIETKAAAHNLKDIIKVSDCVMVARGDLAIETKPEHVPVIQKEIIDLAKRYQKIAIVATQMLESMISSPQPTRAEVSDVATAVVQGTDAVMLSGESAIGKYPVETVSLMKRVILYTEQNRRISIRATNWGEQTMRNAISAAAITLAEKMEAKIILAETATGNTPRNLCSFRPGILVVSVTHSERVYNQLALLWGSRAYLVKSPKTATIETTKMLQNEHNVASGDVIIRALGKHPGVAGGTDTIQVQVVE